MEMLREVGYCSGVENYSRILAGRPAGSTPLTLMDHFPEDFVVGDSIDPAVGAVSHVNANDKTCEGIHYTSVNARTVQFHPEAHGGPLDTSYLFDEFVKTISKK